MSASFIAASTVSSPIDLASSSAPIPARSESAASSVFAVMPVFFTVTDGGVVVGCLARYALRTASFTVFLSQPSAIAFASISGNSLPQTDLTIVTRSRSALTASAAIALASGVGSAGRSGEAAATTVAGVADAAASLGASTVAGAAAGVAVGVSGAAAPAGFVSFLVTLGSMMEFPFSCSCAVTVMCVERSAPTATTETSLKVDFVTW